MIISRRNLLFLVVLGLFFIQCGESNPGDVVVNKVDSLDLDSTKNKADIKQEKISYFPVAYKSNDTLREQFRNQYKGDSLYTILALNRLDKKNIWRADTLVVPSVIEKDFLKYSPFPLQLTVLKEVKKFVYFSYPIQAFSVYENGNLVKWGPTSMGKKATPTDQGLHFANWKKEVAISTSNDEWKLRWNFNISNFKGIGWHQYDLPGYPASHSCLRLLEEDALWLYKFADTWVLNKGGATVRANGTAVFVDGMYNWGGKKPWYLLLSDANANAISEDHMTQLIQPELNKIIAEQQNREEVVKQIAEEKLRLKQVESLKDKI